MTNANNLYKETHAMLVASAFVYALATLRSMARKVKLSGDDDAQALLILPISAGEIAQVLQRNKTLMQEQFGTDKVDFYQNALESLDANDIQVVMFNDENQGIVHGIAVNHKQKRITLAFRGSVTLQDFRADAKTRMRQVPNPVSLSTKRCVFGNAETIGVHNGFYGYLMNNKKKKQTESKYDNIKRHLHSLLVQHPDYKLYITGHSLGGALGTLMSFFLATDRDSATVFSSCITCITFGAPKVGNLNFRRAFRQLEKQGRIKCLRVVNLGDSVPSMPDYAGCGLALPDVTGLFFAFLWVYMLCCQATLYRHVGLLLKLLPQEGKYVLVQPAHPSCCLRLYCRDLCRKTLAGLYRLVTCNYWICCRCDSRISQHSLMLYMERLASVKDELVRFSFVQLYGVDHTCSPPCRNDLECQTEHQHQDESSDVAFVV